MRIIVNNEREKQVIEMFSVYVADWSAYIASWTEKELEEKEG